MDFARMQTNSKRRRASERQAIKVRVISVRRSRVRGPCAVCFKTRLVVLRCGETWPKATNQKWYRPETPLMTRCVCGSPEDGKIRRDLDNIGSLPAVVLNELLQVAANYVKLVLGFNKILRVTCRLGPLGCQRPVS